MHGNFWHLLNFDIFNFKQLVHLNFGHIMMRKKQQYYQTDILISHIEFSLDTRADWCVIYVLILTFFSLERARLGVFLAHNSHELSQHV